MERNVGPFFIFFFFIMYLGFNNANANIFSAYWNYLEYFVKNSETPWTHENVPVMTGRRMISDTCGERTGFLESKILGGTKAPRGAWPWIVALGYQGRGAKINFDCGGVLITRRIVLTAAHCVQPSLYLVRLAGTNLSKSQGLDYGIIDKKVHTEYSTETNENDIALLLLGAAVHLSGDIQLICLPPANLSIANDGVWVAGWGAMDYAGSFSPDLLQVQLNIVDNSECQGAFRSLGHEGPFDARIICAGSGNESRDACQGDSGGPLMWMNSEGKFIVIGIVSYGYKCGEKNIPGVYTSVIYFLPWIKQRIESWS